MFADSIANDPAAGSDDSAGRTDKVRIIVICTGNSCRSQMAEGFFRLLGGDNIIVRSAGVSPGGVNPRAVEAMQEVGIDISGHTSDSLTDYLNESFDYVITVCDNAQKNCPVFPGGGKHIHWPFEDPHDATGTDDDVMGIFRKVRDQIQTKVQAWLADKNSQS